MHVSTRPNILIQNLLSTTKKHSTGLARSPESLLATFSSPDPARTHSTSGIFNTIRIPSGSHIGPSTKPCPPNDLACTSTSEVIRSCLHESLDFRFVTDLTGGVVLAGEFGDPQWLLVLCGESLGEDHR
jgi:hypothetical protein